MEKQGNNFITDIWIIIFFWVIMSGTRVVAPTATALWRLTACAPIRADTMLTTGHSPQPRPAVARGKNIFIVRSTCTPWTKVSVNNNKAKRVFSLTLSSLSPIITLQV